MFKPYDAGKNPRLEVSIDVPLFAQRCSGAAEFFHVGRNDCARWGVFIQTLARNLNDPDDGRFRNASRSMEI
jgi:hypothetical protein